MDGGFCRDPAMLTILYQDDHLIAIDKPPGLLVHRSDIDRHENRFAVQLLRDQVGRRVQPVHRLDKGTSGVLLFAFDAEITRRLGAMFERNEVGKSYLAVVRGWPPESGTVDHPLTRAGDDYGRSPGNTAAQPARTDFRREATIELPVAVDRYPVARYALVRLEPHSGRRHQLRRHMKHIAHPIIGDATHGKGRHNRWFQQQFGCHRLLLACTELRFRHPKTDAPTRLCAPPGDQFADLLRRFGWMQASADATDGACRAALHDAVALAAAFARATGR
jgi:tRNA pseudouridine65 synthase